MWFRIGEIGPGVIVGVGEFQPVGALVGRESQCTVLVGESDADDFGEEAAVAAAELKEGLITWRLAQLLVGLHAHSSSEDGHSPHGHVRSGRGFGSELCDSSVS